MYSEAFKIFHKKWDELRDIEDITEKLLFAVTVWSELNRLSLS